MDTEPTKRRVPWYRCKVSREDLAELNRRSDFLGFLQTGGHLALLTATGAAAWWSMGHMPWPVTVLIVFFHGMCYNFLINGFHELIHESVFKTRFLNGFFLYIFSFLGWYNPHHFWASHTEHHKYTLHPPDDLEVVLPVKLTLRNFLESAVISPRGLYWTLKFTVRTAMGKLDGEWTNAIFPANDPAARRRLRNWARILLVGHGIIFAVSIYMKWWLLPLLISLAPFYGGWLFFLCNNSQHIGLKDNAPDFRLCCRTIYLSPFVRFLYWQMNYHTEHHMYAAVPCYRLGRLHRLIKAEMPPCPRGLYQTWTHIAGILKRQKTEPGYQYVPTLTTGPVASAGNPTVAGASQ